MTLIRGGLIGPMGGGGGGSSTGSLALSDGLACYAESFSGVTTFSIGHNLGTEDLVVEFRDATGNLLLPLNWQVINPNVLDVEFAGPTQGRAVIIGCIESGLAPVTGGVSLLEGLSGIIDLDSPNGSINISTVGQVINLNAIFTPASGALLQQHSADLLTLSGLINQGGGGGGGVTTLQGISGVINLASPNSSIAINVNGQTIELNAIYTWASGQLLESLVTGSGVRAVNGVSGLLDLVSTNNGLTIGVNGQTIQFTSLFTYASGQYIEGVNQRLIALSGLTDGLPRTQTTINGVSGTVNLVAGNNGITVGTLGQTISVSALYTYASGQYVEGINQRLVSLSGLTDGLPRTQTSINGLSGQVQLTSPNNSIGIGSNGQAIELSGLFTAASGQLVDQLAQNINTVSGLATKKAVMTFTETSGTLFVMQHSLNTLDFVFTMWRGNDNGSISYTIPEDIYPSGFNHVVVSLNVAMSGKLVLTG